MAENVAPELNGGLVVDDCEQTELVVDDEECDVVFVDPCPWRSGSGAQGGGEKVEEDGKEEDKAAFHREWVGSGLFGSVS